jgi:hypothetical protein
MTDHVLNRLSSLSTTGSIICTSFETIVANEVQFGDMGKWEIGELASSWVAGRISPDFATRVNQSFY